MPSVRTAVTMSLEKKDLDEVVGIFKTFIKDVQEKDYGVLTYHYFIDDGDRPLIHVFEEYESSKAHLDHFANIDMQAVMPLVRYQTGDCGNVLSHRNVSRILRALKYDAYIPTLNYPLLAVAGRTDHSVTVAGRGVRMELLRAVLYSDYALAALTTGQFTATLRRGRLHVRVQLQAAVESGRKASIQARLSTLFNRHVATLVHAVPYVDFHEGVAVDYERKFNHRSREA